MYYFTSDYTTGCTPEILEVLDATNLEETAGYSEDAYCEAARALIQKECGRPNADVYFMMAGTQTNLTIISAALRPFHGVYGTARSHINTHEAGAIERSGHKVLVVPDEDGKITAAQIAAEQEKYLHDPSREHIVMPKMVYISQPTETGTLYSKKELEELSSVCRKYKLPLFLDGARLGYGLMSEETDVTLPMIAKYCDVFYIGGTKVGALCGEAVVFSGNRTPKHFLTLIKQRGALLAKGRLLGIQFDTLFTDNLYFEISRHAIAMADYLKKGLAEKGCRFYLDSPTNQQFVILENRKMTELKKEVKFSFWEKYDENHTVVRFATSWATKKEEIDQLLDLF